MLIVSTLSANSLVYDSRSQELPVAFLHSRSALFLTPFARSNCSALPEGACSVMNVFI